MPEPIVNAPSPSPSEPELRRTEREPKGVLQKNLKLGLYLGAVLLVIVAAIFSGAGKKTPTQNGAASHQPPQPMLQDSTENNVQDLENQVALAKRKAAEQATNPVPSPDPAFANAVPSQQGAAAPYGPTGQPVPCVSGELCTQAQNASVQPQVSPAQQEEQQLAAKDRELAYESRFASNLVYASAPDPLQQRQMGPTAAEASSSPAASNLVQSRVASDPASAQVSAKPKAEANIDAATGQPYVLYEGSTLDTVLVNRLDGDAAGPVKVLVSNPVYSHDRQHALIPEGTIVLGEARKIGSVGLGQQRRMALVFHRMIMPDGYSVDLDQFHGLDQIGEEGLKDRVNNHYLEIFGTSIALGVISGAGEIEQGGGTISTSGSQAFATGAASSVSQSAATVLDRFIQIPPTITIREGHRIKVYFTQDLLLPAYENHAIPQTF
jgi:type IV secretory pathway VirB10-like protein